MELISLHSEKAQNYPQIKAQCCFILNREWPRSRALRMRTLEASRPELPSNFALVQWFNDDAPFALGHARITRIPAEPDAVWIESVVVHRDLRGLGLGKYLMLVVERFCKERLKFATAYLCTVDMQGFYAKVGYALCGPVCAYGGNLHLPANLEKAMEKSDQVVKPEQVPAPPSANEIAQDARVPCPPPPPPPPLPATITSLVDSNLGDNEELQSMCERAFKRPKLEDLPVTLLENPPSFKEEDDDNERELKVQKSQFVVLCSLKVL